MDLSPNQKQFLEKLGVNTTRLQWKIYEIEKWWANRHRRSVVPAQLRWLSYTHKFCPQCNGIVDRNETVCPACGAKVPSSGLYRVLRAIGLIAPEGAGATTFGFMAIIVALYMLSIFVQGGKAILAPSEATLVRFGMQLPSLVEAGEYWRMLSFGLFHFGLIHIGFNATAILQAGPPLEREIGSRRMLVLITFSQLASAIAVQYWAGGAVGASGWLFGLLGFGISYYHRQGPRWHHIRNFFLQWAAYGFFMGVALRVNNVAHLGGLAGGALLGLTATLTPARKTFWSRFWDFLAWPCMALWIWTLFNLAKSILRT